MFCICWLLYVYLLMLFFFFKQKTAYEMRISDWSSDVCSSDLARAGERQGAAFDDLGIARLVAVAHHHDDALHARDQVHRAAHALDHLARHGPVGQVAIAGNLNGAQYGKVDMPAADHGEAVGREDRKRGV